jgi:hypothetical protein
MRSGVCMYVNESEVQGRSKPQTWSFSESIPGDPHVIRIQVFVDASDDGETDVLVVVVDRG